ncbi:flagellar biosynthesis protein FlaG [Paenisporosarcina cavernae]|uniref:Flagellar biosynthesis protein FlaG n=2 Tax=Paenisporosarcina cavernae TaxID=2320858 RepID=A0A385YWW5_9BACL|nr:flagellar biosynthesis protein FlaG [Paenisporosarcina cavernae]
MVSSTFTKEASKATPESSPSKNEMKDILMYNDEFSNTIEDNLVEDKISKVITALNDFLAQHNRNSKFVMHEGLDRYYVQVVDSETEEVIREVPPKKLLDAYYTMQKYLGMIVDEKI